MKRLKAMQAKQADLAAAEAQTSKQTQELQQRQADSAAAISAAEDRCRDLEAAVNQVSSCFLHSLWFQISVSLQLCGSSTSVL